MDTLKQSLSTTLKRTMDLAQEKGASNWLTSLPIQEFAFALHKGAFQDALSLRYSLQPSGVLHLVHAANNSQLITLCLALRAFSLSPGTTK